MRDSHNPLTVDDLVVGDSWIFHYPFVGTPSFLIRLSESVNKGIDGIGEARDIVAFSAICSHKMTAPATQISHINYRDDVVSYQDSAGELRQGKGLISCCSERSIFDPANGANVLSGPAPRPLAAIRLEADSDGVIVAVESIGGNRYEEFLETFGFRLALESGAEDVASPSGEHTLATPAHLFSKQQIRC